MSEGDSVTMPTIEERENLSKDFTPKRSGFTPRAAEKLTSRRLPRSMLNIECNHVLRQSQEEVHHGNPTMQYRLWLEAGKHTPPFPQRPDKNYNSNVWRNFQKNYGFTTSTEGRNITEVIAAMYPLNIPPPSKVSTYTYAKFLSETPLIKDRKRKRLAIERINNDLRDFENLKLRSELRNPPLDKNGSIVPPLNFKKYEHRFEPPDQASRPADADIVGNTRTDMFGNTVKYKSEPYLWKLTFQTNNPQYEKVREQALKRQKEDRLFPPAISNIKVQ